MKKTGKVCAVARRSLAASITELLEVRRLFATYYVDQSIGNDLFNGLQLTVNGAAGPLKTISKAATLANAGDSVLIRAGTYRETVTPARSGTSALPITYASYNNENVVVSGADVLTGWSVHSGNVYKAPMSWTMGGYTAEDDQLFVDGQQMIYARWPNTTLDLSHPSVEHAGAGSTGSLSGSVLTQKVVDTALTQASGTWTGATIHINPGPNWIYETRTISGYTQGTVTYTSSFSNTGYLATQGNPYYITGKFVCLDTASEYFRDSATSTMYLWTPASDSPSGHLVEAKRRVNAFDVSAKSYINITGLKFFAAGLSSSSSTNRVVLDGVKASYVSYFASWNGNFSAKMVDNGIILNGTNNTFKNGEINFSAGNGIVLIGSGHSVTNNVIHDVNYMGLDNSAVTSFDGYPSTAMDIGYNTIFNSGRGLIVHRAMTASRIHHNRMWGAMLQTTDGGATYCFQNTGGNFRIDHNIISDSINYEVGNAANGIMLDGSSGGYVVDHNVIWNTTGAILSNGPTSANLFYNNTAANSIKGLSLATTTAIGEVTNNLFVSPSSWPSGQTALTNINSSTIDAKFTNPQLGDYTIQSNSPGVDAGTVVSPYTDGFTGAAPDIGAFEYGQPAWTAGATGTYTSSIPAAPSNLTAARISASQINLSWVDNASNESGFAIDRSADGNTFQMVAKVGAGVISYADTGLGLSRYTYRVRAFSGTVNGGYGSPSSLPASALTGRDAYTRQDSENADAQSGGVAINATSVGSFDNNDWLQYSLMEFGSGGATTFSLMLAVPAAQAGKTVEVRLGSVTGTLAGTLIPADTGGFGAYALQTANLSLTVTGNHSVFLVAKGGSGVCNMDYFYFGAAPVAPTNVVATPLTTSSIRLNWTDNSANETGFEVERATNSTFTTGLTLLTTTAANVTTYTDVTGLSAGTTYYYRVRSTNATGDSVNSATASGTTLPTAPTITQLLTDTGSSSSDRITNTNNSAVAKALQFLLSGLQTGAAVSLFDGATVLASGVAAGSTLTLTTSGTLALADGVHNFTATQTVGGSVSALSGSMAVTIDATAPVLAGLASVTREAVSTLGTVVTYTSPTASDVIDPAPSLGISAPSGSTFSMGATTVNVSTSDKAGNLAAGSFTVTVNDPAWLARGSGAAYTFTTPMALTVSGGTVSLTGNAGAAGTGRPGLVLTAQAGSLVRFSASQVLGGLVINGATAAVVAGGNVVLELGGLAVNATGTLDMSDGAGVIRNGDIGAVTALLKRGINADVQLWMGTGITSSLAAADVNNVRAVGAINNVIDGTSIYDTFRGVSVGTTDVLLAYTYFGDADLSGVVDDTDYFLANTGYLAGATGWLNGDFDYSGVVDDTDYFLLNTAYLLQ